MSEYNKVPVRSNFLSEQSGKSKTGTFLKFEMLLEGFDEKLWKTIEKSCGTLLTVSSAVFAASVF